MSDVLIVTLAAAATVGLVTWQVARLTRAVAAIHAEVIEVHHTFNSKMDALLTVTGESEHAKGVLQGRAERDSEAPAAADRQGTGTG